MNLLKQTLLVVFLAVVPSLFNSCDRTETDPTRTQATVGGNPIVTNGRILPYLPQHFHKGCFTRYYYYDMQGTHHEQILPEPRVIEFDPRGTDLGEMILPDFTIHTFELIFEPSCQSALMQNNSLVIDKEGEDLVLNAYHSFKFRGYYNKRDMNASDIVFNFGNFIELFETANTAPEFFQKFQFVSGSFGPQTKVKTSFSSSDEIHLGCLYELRVINETGGFPISILPRVVKLNPGNDVLLEVGLPPGKYYAAFLVFGPHCNSNEISAGSSYQVTNDHGTFATPQTMTFSLHGDFAIPEERDQNLVLDLAPVLNRFRDVQSQSEFDQALPTVNDVVGSF